MVSRQVPDRGDLIWLNFSPQKGRETAGNRPALVLTPAEYNRKVGRAIVCPVTSREHTYPFMVPLPQDLEIKGWIIADQIRAVDWRARNARFIAKAGPQVMEEVQHWLGELLGLS
jgi:mRNA interferase MazF